MKKQNLHKSCLTTESQRAQTTLFISFYSVTSVALW